MRLIRSRPTEPVEGRTDADLTMAAACGDGRAFEELYRRHAPAAWGVATAVAPNPDDAADAVSDAFTRVLRALREGRLERADAFRPYLIAAARNAAIDGLRRGGRAVPTDEPELLDGPAATGGPADHLTDADDSKKVLAAFRELPERWRSVLWLTEVEGLPPREAAEMLGLTANTTAQLAVRARAGLRERYLQAHVTQTSSRLCRFTTGHLGAYVAGRLAPRDLAKVDQHLAGCDSCRSRRDELEDLGAGLRRVVLPLPLLLGGVSLTKWKTMAASLPAAASSAAPGPGAIASLTAKAQKPLLATTSGIFALGVISASVVGQPNAPLAGSTPAAPRTAPSLPAESVEAEIMLATGTSEPGPFVVDFSAPTSVPAREPEAEPADEASTAPPAAAALPPTSTTAPPTTTPPTTTPPREPKPTVQTGIGVTIGGLEAEVNLGVGDGACVGATLPVAGGVGCQDGVDAPAGTGVTVDTGGALPGEADDEPITATLPGGGGSSSLAL